MTESTTGTAPSPVGRWRITADETQTVTGLRGDIEDSITVVEFLVGEVGDARALVRVVRSDPWDGDSVVLSITKTELQRLVGLAAREPSLVTDHDEYGGYFDPGSDLFRADPLPSDVNQGNVGNCRVASAFQAIAATKTGPALLRSLITAGGGGYQVTLRRTAGPKISPSTTETAAVLQISGFLPVDRRNTSPLYALKGAQLEGTVTVSLWPALMEKAFAQMWGGYTSLDGAEEFPVFAALGLTEKFIVNWYGNYLGKTQAARKKIIELAAGGWVLTAATSMGVRHNYAVLAADDSGVLLSDPNTARTAAAEKRWKEPDFIKDTYGMRPQSDKFPLRFGWEIFFDSYTWVYAAKAPAAKK